MCILGELRYTFFAAQSLTGEAKLYEREKAATAFPLNSMIREGAANLILTSRQIVEPSIALRDIGKALGQDPYSPSLLLAYAKYQFAAGNLAGARLTLKRLAAIAYSGEASELGARISEAERAR